jgi:predicted 3-demethylubiquinone-9 3-methyltransferase (glyoxalase superfamily)
LKLTDYGGAAGNPGSFLRSKRMQKITPFLWFDEQAEEAMNFYISIFKNSRQVALHDGAKAAPAPGDQLWSATFGLDGHFMALNGGPHFTFSPAISSFVNCTTQEEVDELCVSWQIIPSALGKMLQINDPEKAKKNHAGHVANEQN